MNDTEKQHQPLPWAAWHALAPRDVLASVGGDPVHGHTRESAARALADKGANSLIVEKDEPWWEEALEFITEPLQLLLIAVAAAYFWFGETEDAITILAVIVTVAGIEVFSELRAKRAVASLSRWRPR